MNKIKSLSGVLTHKLFGKRLPLSVSWSLTNRCNFRCNYCNVYYNKTEELDTETIFRILEELKQSGVQRIGFTGGEPFLRDDIGQILVKCRELGIFCGVVTNGSIIDERAKLANLIQISLDGPKEINDRQRCKGSFDAAINALEKLKKRKTWITTVLTKNNLDQVEYMVDIARKYDSVIYFQPCLDYELCGPDSRNMLPAADRFRQAINKIISIRAGDHVVGNSRAGLKALLNFPNKKPNKCYAGNLYCHIYSNGQLYSCFNMQDKKGIDLKKKSFVKSFEKLQQPECEGCFSYATIEMNLTFALHPESAMNALRLVR
ncbi:radical SAM protein [Candidatus Woesearchaeota archaeon]|nr:radical SAM protein [Candidatus Woesearchaeota archaeon]